MLKKLLSLFMCVLIFGAFFVLNGADCTAAVSVSAQSAVLFCSDNGEFLFEKEADKKLPMASTTKVMTALIALEAAAAENKEVKFTNEMIAEGSSMYLKEGDVLTLTGLVKGLLATSGNDAANAIAISLAGSKEEFAKLMNEKALQIGMKSTNFVTPSGLDAEGHYSTARDMAVLLAYAMENETFADITAQKSVKVEFVCPENHTVTYGNHNRLLSIYEHCIGGKTGFTKTAGRCLVSCAEKDGVHLVAVTLNAPDDWKDHTNMYNYGFDSLSAVEMDDTKVSLCVPVVGGTEETVTVTGYKAVKCVVDKNKADNIERNVRINHFLYAPVTAGEQSGEIVYTVDGKTVAKTKLVCEKEVRCYIDERNTFQKIWEGFMSLFK